MTCHDDNALTEPTDSAPTKEIDMTTQQITDAIAAFARDLDNSVDMRDRRDAVQYLANKLGSTAANQIAEIYGLHGAYYKA